MLKKVAFLTYLTQLAFFFLQLAFVLCYISSFTNPKKVLLVSYKDPADEWEDYQDRSIAASRREERKIRMHLEKNPWIRDSEDFEEPIFEFEPACEVSWSDLDEEELQCYG